MKSIYKLMSIMLFVSLAMVACKDPEPEPQPEPEDLTPAYSVVLNGQEYNTFAYKVAKIVNTDQGSGILLEGHPQDISDPSQISSEYQVCPGFRVILRGTTTGTYESTTIDPETGYLNGNVLNYEFYKSGALYKDGVFYGDWWGLDAKVNLTKFDVTKGLASFTASGNMFSSGQAFLQGQGIEDADRGTMTITIKNMPVVQ